MDKKDANILLISDKEYEYLTLVEAGYKNIFWFKSSLRAYEYYKNREDELKKFDIILLGSRTLSHFDCGKYYQPITDVTFYSCEVEKMSFFTGYCEEDERRLFWISHPNVTGMGVPENEFLDVLDRVIPDELKGEVIEIPQVLESEVKFPNTRQNVRVLFIGSIRDNDLVESFFKEAGFINYEFIKDTNFSLENNVEKLADYDLIVADKFYCGKLSLMGDEFQDYMKDKGKSICFAVYKSSNNGSNTNELYMEEFSTENPDNKKKITFKSMESESDALKDLMGLVVNSYCSYNKNIGDGGYPSEKDLNQKYEAQYAAACEESRIGTERIYELITIQRYLDDYRTYVNRGFKMPDMEKIRIDILQDGMSVAFLAGAREGVRITFKDGDRKPGEWCDRFYLEYLSEKGKMIPVKMRRYYPHYYDPSLNIENLASEEEMKKVDAMYNRICSVLKPIIDKMKEIERAKEEKKYRNKKYNKKYV